MNKTTQTLLQILLVIIIVIAIIWGVQHIHFTS